MNGQREPDNPPLEKGYFVKTRKSFPKRADALFLQTLLQTLLDESEESM